MQRTLLRQALFMDILKVPGIVRMLRIFLPGNFFKNISKVPLRVRTQQTLFSRHFFMEILKVPGIVRMQQTPLFLPGTFLLKY